MRNNHPARRVSHHLVWWFAVLALLQGCGSGAPMQDAADGPRIWPPPPAEPRVAYVTQFSSAADLGIEMGLLGRLTGILTGRREVTMSRPMAVVVTSEEVYYVADPGRKGVHRYDRKRGSYRLISGPGHSALPSPVGLALAAGGGVYVADSFLGRLYLIAPGADEAVPLELEDPPEQPTGVAVDPASGRLYVTDTTRHQVVIYGADGRVEKRVGRRGSGEGEFNFPTMVWMTPQGHLLVTDSMNFRISAFNLDGGFLYSFGRHGDGSGDLSRPKGVATDGEGHIYVTDALFHVFQIFDNQGNFLLTVGDRGGVAGEFLLPTGIYINGDNTVFICDSQNHRVQVFRYIGS